MQYVVRAYYIQYDSCFIACPRIYFIPIQCNNFLKAYHQEIKADVKEIFHIETKVYIYSVIK